MFSFYLSGLKKIFSIGKKILLVAVVYTVIVALFFHFINKNKPTSTYNPIQENRNQTHKVINDPELNKTKEGKLKITIFRTVICTLTGEGCTNNPKDGEKNFQHSVLGIITKTLITPFSNPPASGIYWTYNGLQDAGFIPKSYASGFGLVSISSLSKMWSALRSVAYMILVLFIITIGFLIMFRTKINPQTVISIENSLPRIILTLLFITFSFAIAGFLIDLMYLAIILIIQIFGPAANLAKDQILQHQQIYLQADLNKLFGPFEGFGGWWTLVWTLPSAIIDVIPHLHIGVRALVTYGGIAWLYPWLKNDAPIVSNLVKALVDWEATMGVGIDGWNVGDLVTGPWVLIALAVIVGIISALATPLVVGVFIWFTVIFIWFRLLFMLISSYIKIFILIIISPLYLLLEIIPGNSTFTNWIRNLSGELITFPSLVAVFMLSEILVINANSGNLTVFPFMFGLDPKNFTIVISYALFFMTPDLIKLVQQFINSKPAPISAGVGMFFGGATTGISGGLGEISKWASLAYYIAPLRPIVKALTGNMVDLDKMGGQHNPAAGHSTGR